MNSKNSNIGRKIERAIEIFKKLEGNNFEEQNLRRLRVQQRLLEVKC